MNPIIKTPARIAYNFYMDHLRHVLGPYSARTGAIIYNNCAGLNRNLTGHLAELKSSVRSNVSHTNLPDANYTAAQQLREQGYADMGNPFDDGVLETVRSKYNDLIEDDSATEASNHREVPGDEVYKRSLINPAEKIPELTDLLTDEVTDTIRAYYNANFQILCTNAYRTRHIPEELFQETDVFADNWHMDRKPTDHIKLFVTLSETTAADGPFHIVSKDDVAKIAKQIPEYDRFEHGMPGEIVNDITNPVTLTGEPGTAMFGNSTLNLHRAGNPEEGHTRDLLQYYIAPASEPWSGKVKENGNPHGGGFFRLLKY